MSNQDGRCTEGQEKGDEARYYGGQIEDALECKCGFYLSQRGAIGGIQVE